MERRKQLEPKRKDSLDHSLVNRFRNAVECLCVGKGDVRSRLRDAFDSIFVFRPENIPEKFRKDWKVLWHKITCFSPRGKEYYEDDGMGDFEATLKRIKNKTASKMVQLIFDIHIYLTE